MSSTFVVTWATNLHPFKFADRLPPLLDVAMWRNLLFLTINLYLTKRRVIVFLTVTQ